MFFNDFEAGEILGDDPSRHFQNRLGDGRSESFKVIDGALMGGRSGRVLRGNMWEYIDGERAKGQAYDPLAASVGVSIAGTKSPDLTVRLSQLGVPQVPPADANAASPGPAELYVSVWLWFDADFTFDARQEDGRVTPQSVKLYYAFGPNGTMWVTTLQNDSYHHFLNVNGLDWFKPLYASGPSPMGAWRHLEFYFRSETQSVFYEYGGFSSRPDLLASKCPGAQDYTIQFPVVGTDPQICLSGDEALLQNSQDGVYVLRVDGQLVIDRRDMPWNGRFGQFNFPAWHGGGGQAIASAGWAVDDLCVRSAAPEGFVP